eukprot:TRINITY_DN43609_c0_g1_i1.p1 TRINITY_DN43609_c0_g1~~TRINITY_DN43609_c0_g1_i1.p1  ORF type:complete len:100 (+),score=25.78 TRINITY_DN43609_c0_g1_i1:152-451(+)
MLAKDVRGQGDSVKPRTSLQNQKNLKTVEKEQKEFADHHLKFGPESDKSCCIPVSYTHLTLPTILLVQISVGAVSLKKKKTQNKQFSSDETEQQKYTSS